MSHQGGLLTGVPYERLCSGGWVVASSDRAARALEARFNRQRSAEGLSAWLNPNIRSWKKFVLDEVQSRTLDDRMILSTAQEHALWEQIVGGSSLGAALLQQPRHRIAKFAYQAHELLCSHAPQFLSNEKRTAWQQDAETFSVWLAQFDDRCRNERLLSACRLPLELVSLLHQERTEQRPPLLLAGFDRLSAVQRELLGLWGDWQFVESGVRADAIGFHQTVDAVSELAACADWCNRRLDANPLARLLVVSQDIAVRRGELERAFRRSLSADRANSFEFSLGVPLAQVSLARGARSLLHWLTRPLAENELDWLLSTGQIDADAAESADLFRLMRQVRRFQSERPEWALDEFIQQTRRLAAKGSESATTGSESALKSSESAVKASEPTTAPVDGLSNGQDFNPDNPIRSNANSPPIDSSSCLDDCPDNRLNNWSRRMTSAAQQLLAAAGPGMSRKQTPLEWATLAREVLKAAGWPGYRALSSGEHQAMQRFDEALDDCATLGFDGRRISWTAFLSTVVQTLGEILFSAESREASILIAGPLESAGLTADGIWFLAAEEGKWPSAAPLHPMLPAFVQREEAMPHATADLDWEMARAVTERLLGAAPEVHFSCARLRGDIETRSSRLIIRIVGEAKSLPFSTPLLAPLLAQDRTERVPDAGGIRYPHPTARGGTKILSLQSQCAFRAFATSRLNAQGWTMADAVLTAAQRGTLLHNVLLRVWGGTEQGGLASRDDLVQLISQDRTQIHSFVGTHVRAALREELARELRERLPVAYIQLEEERLTELVIQWLLFESKRQRFNVVAREQVRTAEITSLAFRLRIDRIDQLDDGSLLVIDYKTSDAKPSLWELPRPEDIQLPLYVEFAVDSASPPTSAFRLQSAAPSATPFSSAISLSHPDPGAVFQPGRNLAGLVFAKLRPHQLEFAGRVFNANDSLFPHLNRSSALVKNPLTDNQLRDWHDAIEQLADEFVQGRAVVDPRDPPKTCQYCGLQTLCRIAETGRLSKEEEDAEECAEEGTND